MSNLQENAPGPEKSNATKSSHIAEETARFCAEIEHAEGEANAEALLTKRLAEKEGK